MQKTILRKWGSVKAKLTSYTKSERRNSSTWKFLKQESFTIKNRNRSRSISRIMLMQSSKSREIIFELRSYRKRYHKVIQHIYWQILHRTRQKIVGTWKTWSWAIRFNEWQYEKDSSVLGVNDEEFLVRCNQFINPIGKRWKH